MPVDNLTVDMNVSCLNELCVSEAEYLDLLEEYVFPSPYEWGLISLHVAVFVVGLVGNALVCIAVYRNPSMRTVTNYFIVNLAVADFMVILVCLPPTVLWDVTETWFFGGALCKIVLYLQCVSVSVSVLTLTFISVDRWRAICRPLHAPGTPGARAAISTIWCVSCLMVLPELVVLDTRRGPVPGTIYLTDCTYTWSPGYTSVYQVCLVFLLYVVPFTLMSAVYYQIARVLWRLPALQECRNGLPPPQTLARRKAAKMLLAVVTLFGLCYMPVHTLNLLRYTTDLPQTPLMSVASLLSHWLCYFNSAINPIVYNFMSGKFRKEYSNSFRWLFKRVLLCGAVRDEQTTSEL
ncbi:orexin/Hypocretin receptor type 1-like isoform X1 [Ornithodoros turicata]|uniref:orexin/Hypocretin receptor type 1-like isoform X1 n=1 Tax=Ornithodoros turicata TaxID=34597 RepID=UPI003138EEBB